MMRLLIVSLLCSTIVAFGHFKPTCDDLHIALDAKVAIDMCIDGYDESDFMIIDNVKWVRLPYAIRSEDEPTIRNLGYEYNASYTYRYYKARVYCEPLYLIRIAVTMAFTIS